jgi:hypothetical protein
MGHPAGKGTWKVWLRAAPELCVLAAGHTAREAWENARPELLDLALKAERVALVDFSDCCFDLVSDSPPKPATRRRRTNSEAERLHRVVAQGREQFICGSGRA